MVQAVVLDLDGLMINSEPLHQRAFNALLKRYDIDYQFETEEYGKCFVGIPVVENASYVIARFNLPNEPDAIIAEREAIFEELISHADNLSVMPGLFPFLDAVQARGLPLAVASGSPRHQVDTMLRGIGVLGRLDAVVGGTDVRKTKPAPDVYLRATALLGASPENCVALEDSLSGVRAAKAAGLYAIAIPNQFTSHQDLSLADARAQNLDEALKYVLNGHGVK